MPRLFFGNFDFDQQLADNRQNPPESRRRINAELAACWLAVAEDDDWIWCPEPVEPEYWERMFAAGHPAVHPVSETALVPAGLELTPWGWTDKAREFAQRIRAVIDAPPQAVVCAANSRRLSFQCETEWGVGIPGEVCVESSEQLFDAIRRVADDLRWVLKAEFSGAARERLLGRGPSLDVSTQRWAEQRLRRGQSLFLERWLDRIDEAGIQWTVPRVDPPVLEGVTPLLTDAAGRYRGSRFGIDESEAAVWSDAVNVGRRLALQLQQMGYFGPLGIDAMRYRDAGGQVRLRPLQDVNSRWTMGRLSLGWRRFVARGVWHHGPRARLRESDGVVRDGRVTSADFVGGRPTQHASWLEVQD
jgi:hypothetical protein